MFCIDPHVLSFDSLQFQGQGKRQRICKGNEAWLEQKAQSNRPVDDENTF
jgi:hypothetical protein